MILDLQSHNRFFATPLQNRYSVLGRRDKLRLGQAKPRGADRFLFSPSLGVGQNSREHVGKFYNPLSPLVVYVEGFWEQIL